MCINHKISNHTKYYFVGFLSIKIPIHTFEAITKIFLYEII